MNRSNFAGHGGGVTLPSRYLSRNVLSAKAIPSVQRVVRAADKAQIIDRGVAACRPGPHVIVFEKSPHRAAPPIRRYERTAPLIARVHFTPDCRGEVTAALADAKRIIADG